MTTLVLQTIVHIYEAHLLMQELQSLNELEHPDRNVVMSQCVYVLRKWLCGFENERYELAAALFPHEPQHVRVSYTSEMLHRIPDGGDLNQNSEMQ
jgi:hypothetical protein